MFVLFLSFFDGIAQQLPTEAVSIDKSTPTDVWEVYFESPEVRIEYSLHDCDATSGYDFQAVFIRYTNLTGDTLNLTWHWDLYYDITCRTCNYDEYNRSLTLAPSEVLEGSCANNSNLKLELFSKFIDEAYTKGAQLTSFQFTNLNVNQ